MTRYIAKFQTRLAAVRDHYEEGATAVEYGLMVALIAAAIMATVGLLGGQLNTLFNNVRLAITPAG